MDTGFDPHAPLKFKPISVERAVTMLTHFRIQLVDIDPDNPRALRFLMDNHQTLTIEPHKNRLEFRLSVPPDCGTTV